MLARNPKTGGTIRIIQSDASLWRDQKTLIWTNAKDTTIRFETGTTSSATASGQDIVLLLGPLEDEAAWLRSEAAEKPSLVGITKALVEFVGLAELAKLRLPNLLCLDEIHELYPFVGPAWDGSVEDAKAIVAAALRFARSGPCAAPARAAAVEPLGITYFGPETVPVSPPLWFITQYYTPEKRRRAVEIRRCLEKNIACDAIDRIILLNEKPVADPLVKDPKVHEVVVGQRLTYAKVLQWIQEEAPDDAIIVFANADIYLDAESFGLLWSVGLEDRCLALLRWDEQSGKEPVLFGPRADSQDAWVVTAASVKKRQWPWPAFSFPFGQGGCDNAFALEMFKQKFLVANPALSLRTIHVHESGVRGYDPKDIVDKPAYLYIQPTGLHDLQPIYTVPKELIAKTLSREAVEHRIEGPLSEAQAKTFATMVTRSLGEGSIEYGSANRWAPGPVALEKRSRIFQTRDGLRFTTNSLLIGPTKAARELWTNVQLSTMAASVHTGRAFIAPLSKEIIASPGRYMLEYLSKIFLMREQVPEWAGAEFWASRAKPIMEALQLFHWGKEIPVLAYDDTPQAWCEEALIWPHEDFNAFVSAEQIGALRRALKQEWYPEPVGLRRIVVAVDGDWIQESLVDELEKAFATEGTMFDPVWPTTSIDVLVSKLRGAAGLIVSSGVGSFAWALPAGATVWEVQSEMAPSVSLLHLAAAGGLKHRLTIVPKATSPSAAQLSDLKGKLLKDMATLEATKKLPPLIVLPAAASGFFAHAGDSFREMVRLWEAAGYVRVERDPKATQVWLSGIGQVLLYDRPTLEWLRAAPKEELMWRKALFGNPPALKRESSWFFWPRRPELVERLAGGATASWSERSGTVFYGKVENAVQAANRVETWKEACDTWVLAKGGEAYALTQEEYLRALGRARFGLCLAGYGNKCHREIECMAMGTVPICAPEVDMENYADPPVEGVHYLRASEPKAARALAAATPEEKWSAMSAACQEWWRRNASVAGSWELTRRLAEC